MKYTSSITRLWDIRTLLNLAVGVADVTLEEVTTMNISNIESVSGFQAAITQQKVDIAVLKKSLDASKTQADAALEMLQSAAEITSQDQSTGNTLLDLTI